MFCWDSNDLHQITTFLFAILNRYDPAMGVFTVPPGGEGHFFLVTDLTVDPNEHAYTDLHVNGEAVCSNVEDTQAANGFDSGGCTAIVFLQEGNFMIF